MKIIDKSEVSYEYSITNKYFGTICKTQSNKQKLM